MKKTKGEIFFGLIFQIIGYIIFVTIDKVVWEDILCREWTPLVELGSLAGWIAGAIISAFIPSFCNKDK